MKNVILITIDTLRRDVFGCYGKRPSLTPFMDSIQGRCIRFEKAYATGPYTQASFPGILTSTYYLEYGRQMMLPTEKTLISEALKKGGIITAAFHSNPYLSQDFGWNRGWDTFYDSIDDDVPDLYPFIRGRQINRKVGTWLSGNITDDPDSPFFLWVHYMDVHEPYVPEEEFVKAVDADLKLEKEAMYALFRDVILKRDTSDKSKVGLLRKLYSAKVLEVDDCVRELFGIFETAGVLDRSVIFFASDHGDEFGEHGGLSHDGKMYSELVGVPLFIWNRDKAGGAIYNKPVSNIDISPTIAHLFELGRVGGFKGSSLLPTEGLKTGSCFGEAINKRGHREKKEDGPIYYCLRGSRKIIFNRTNGSWELYDLENDPGERTNLIETGENAGELREELEAFLQDRPQE